jgi:hypothetical protein
MRFLSEIGRRMPEGSGRASLARRAVPPFIFQTRGQCRTLTPLRKLDETLSHETDGQIVLTARVWAVKGAVH